MRKLTRSQLMDLRIFNCWDFRQGSPGVFHSHNKWFIEGKGIPKTAIGTAATLLVLARASADPNDTEGALGKHIAKTLTDLGITVPDRWIKFMGTWMDEAFYKKRMAELVARYKEFKR